MKSNGDWVKYLLFSGDPAVTFVSLVICCLLVSIALVAGAFIAIPFGIGFAVVKWMQWHARHPVPTAEMFAATEQRVIAANFPDAESFSKAHMRRLMEAWRPRVPNLLIFQDIMDVAEALYELEDLGNPLPVAGPMGPIEEGRYRDRLILQGRKSMDAPATLATFADALSRSFTALREALPPLACSTPQELLEAGEGEAKPVAMVPLVDLIPDVGQVVWDVAMAFYTEEVNELGLFQTLRAQLDANDRLASTGSAKYVSPQEYKGTPREIVSAYLGGTPLERLFATAVPFRIGIEDRLEHTAIVAGSGWGKTQLLQNLIAADLTSEDPPALVIIDSTGAMVQLIQRLAVFNRRLKDRLLIIDPELDPVPALNMFDMSNPRLQSYEANVRESFESDVVALFNYVFSSIENPLTARQATAFAFIIRLVLSIPAATIHTMRTLLEDNPRGGYQASPFKPQIDALDDTAQAFFKTQYFSSAFAPTREQIAQRVYAVIKVPVFERMFSTVNRLDMFTELNRGAVILINTSENFLKDASPLFGRYMIARVMAAAFERASIPREERRPAFLIVDEAAPYFDSAFEKLLTRVRQFKLGVVIAFQHMEQAGDGLRSAIASSTGIKYAGGLGYNDSRWLAREMRVDPEFILAQKRDGSRPPQWTHFACYVRNLTDRAVSLKVPFHVLQRMPAMSEAQHAALMQRNTQRVCGTASSPPVSPAAEGEPGLDAPTQSDTPMAAVPASSSEPSIEGSEDWR